MKKIKSYPDTLTMLAKSLKKHRQAKGLTQEEMADHGFNYRHYQKIESGKYSPNLFTLHRLCVVLGITMEELFKGT